MMKRTQGVVATSQKGRGWVSDEVSEPLMEGELEQAMPADRSCLDDLKQQLSEESEEEDPTVFEQMQKTRQVVRVVAGFFLAFALFGLGLGTAGMFISCNIGAEAQCNFKSRGSFPWLSAVPDTFTFAAEFGDTTMLIGITNCILNCFLGIFFGIMLIYHADSTFDDADPENAERDEENTSIVIMGVEIDTQQLPPQPNTLDNTQIKRKKRAKSATHTTNTQNDHNTNTQKRNNHNTSENTNDINNEAETEEKKYERGRKCGPLTWLLVGQLACTVGMMIFAMVSWGFMLSEMEEVKKAQPESACRVPPMFMWTMSADVCLFIVDLVLAIYTLSWLSSLFLKNLGDKTHDPKHVLEAFEW